MFPPPHHFFFLFFFFTKTESCKPPHPTFLLLHMSLLVLPAQRSKANLAAAPVSVCWHWAPEELNCSPSSFQLCAMGHFPPFFSQNACLTSPQTMKEFWFFNFSSSLICCLRKSILWGMKDNHPLVVVLGLRVMLHAPTIIYSHLCSRSVAWISQTLTKERRFLSSVQFSDIQMLPMVWASSRSLDALIIVTSHTFV